MQTARIGRIVRRPSKFPLMFPLMFPLKFLDRSLSTTEHIDKYRAESRKYSNLRWDYRGVAY